MANCIAYELFSAHLVQIPKLSNIFEEDISGADLVNSSLKFPSLVALSGFAVIIFA